MAAVNLGTLIVLCFAVVGFARADTPANCTYEDAVGLWQFTESVRNGSNNIQCSSVTKSSIFSVKLEYPDVAIDNNGHVGFWTLIYNQGFEVVINKRKYFSFFKYSQNGPNVISYCNILSPGLAHDILERDWSCFEATKVSMSRAKYSGVFNKSHGNRPYQSNFDFINKINSVQKSWKAAHYLEYSKMTIGQLQARKGGLAPLADGTKRVKPARPTLALRKEADVLPDNFDWRNRFNFNYVDPVPDQGSCGSCYSFSSTGMIASRLRVLTNNTVAVQFSEQDIVECSPYSQGCNGGFPYLIAGKYAEDFGFVEESCNPYIGEDGTCKTKSNCKRYYATNYRYVGGYYGACNEEAMKIALVTGGPLSVSFMVYDDFMHYSSGIYRHSGLKDKFNPFEITNHAVLLVGYGVTSSGEKYWSVRNSWGTSWGEGGFFRIARGVDECAIESIAVEAFPIVN